MKHRFSSLALIGLAVLCLPMTGCDETLDGNMDFVSASVVVTHSDNDNISSISNECYTFKNISDGTVTTLSSAQSVPLLPGIYDVAYTADAVLKSGAKAKLRALKQSVYITSSSQISLQDYCIVDTDDLILSEIFYTGTLQPSGVQYNGDSYFKLYNNTDHVVYADGLTLFETKFLTTEKRNYTPDVMDEAVTVQALYTIPGSGNEHPVMPGEELLICDVGIDHRTINPNSFSLEHADFEWYDKSTKPSTTDIDSPLVPNLDKWYCYTLSIWVPHNRGFKAFGLARIPVSRDEYLLDYRYAFDYDLVTAAGTFPMSDESYKLPNEWVVDIVNCSIESDYSWQLCIPALDSGWTYCGTVNNDKTRYFHSVRRKVLRIEDDGRIILKDTNNSSEDFNPYVVPSEIELQHTSVDAAGNKSTVITYDGVLEK